MATDISSDKIKKILGKLKHPSINRTLVELGMIKDIKVKNNKATITLVFPFEGIPIKDYLIDSVKTSLSKFGVNIEIKTTVMNQEELQKFLDIEQRYWKD